MSVESSGDMPPTVVIATPHARNDVLEARVRDRLRAYQVARLRTKQDLSLEVLEALRPELVFFPHWSWVIPPEIHARFECVIFHMTDLPYGRGGSPLQNLIVRGHRETQVTALRCVSGIDAGPVYAKRPLSLEGTAEEILVRASALMEEMIADIVERRPVPIPQEGEVVTFTRRRPEDGNLAPLDTLPQVYDYIRMLDGGGYPPAFVDVEGWRFEFSDALLYEDSVEAKVRIRRIR